MSDWEIKILALFIFDLEKFEQIIKFFAKRRRKILNICENILVNKDRMGYFKRNHCNFDPAVKNNGSSLRIH